MLEDNRTILFVNSLTTWSRRLWIPSMMIMARNHLLKKLLPEMFPLTLVNVASSRISKNMLPNISECCLTIVNCPSLLLGCIGWKCSEKRKELRQIKGRGAYSASTTRKSGLKTICFGRENNDEVMAFPKNERLVLPIWKQNVCRTE